MTHRSGAVWSIMSCAIETVTNFRKISTSEAVRNLNVANVSLVVALEIRTFLISYPSNAKIDGRVFLLPLFVVNCHPAF